MTGVRVPLVVLTVLLTAAAPLASALSLQDVDVEPQTGSVPGALLDGSGWSQRGSPAGAPTQGIAGSADVLVASTWGKGAYRSTNGGLSWDLIPGIPVDEASVAWDPADPAVGYIAGFGGVVRTADAGLTWDPVTSDSPAYCIATSPTGAVAFTARAADSSTNIWRSTDHGVTWTQTLSPLPLFSSCYGLTFGLNDDNLVLMNIGKTWASNDGGASWTETGGGGWDVTTDTQGRVWRAAFGPPQRSDDGGFTWFTQTTPVNFKAFEARPNGGLFASGFDGVYVSDDGITWTNMGFGEVAFAELDLFTDPNDADAVFMTDENVGVTRIAPDGSGGFYLEGRTTGFPPVALDTAAASADGTLLLAGGSLGLYASRDGGHTWGHTGAGAGLNGVDAAAANHDGSVVYAGGQSMIFAPWVQASRDGGRTWIFTSMDINDGRVVAFAPHADEPLVAFAAVWSELATSFVAVTYDGGETWERLWDAPDHVFDVAYLDGADKVLAATESGVYSIDGSGIGTPVLVHPLGSGAVAARGTTAYAEGLGTSVWKTVDADIFAPHASAGTDLRGLAADASGVWAIPSDGTVHHCVDSGALLGTCADAAFPAPNAIAVTTAADEVWVATGSEGLYVR